MNNLRNGFIFGLVLLGPAHCFCEPLVLAVIGDYGNCDSGGKTPERCSDPKIPEVRVAELVKSWHPQAILTVGDNSYTAGSAAEVASDQLPYQDYVRSGTFFPSWGNHDWGHSYRTPPSLESSFAYFGIHDYYYAHEFSGLLTAYFLDTNPEDPAGDNAQSTQAAWFQAELRKSRTPWNVTINHQPPYATCDHQSHAEFRWLLVPKIDVAISGHSHSYERLIEPNAAGTGTLPCVVVGTGGAALEPPSNCRDTEPGQKKLIAGHYGALKLEITPQKLVGTFYTLDGGVQDSFTLTK